MLCVVFITNFDSIQAYCQVVRPVLILLSISSNLGTL